jgi:hypothetical protein
MKLLISIFFESWTHQKRAENFFFNDWCEGYRIFDPSITQKRISNMTGF